MNYPLIYIEWCDALSYDTGWIDEEEMMEWSKNEEWIVKQTGWLIDENEQYITLAGKMSPHESAKTMFSKFTKIPKTWIKQRREITI